ncbi:MAG: GntR family transcriptional regulator [Rhodobacter sp.]|nr:GntR family transcriptional regulator [Rhodobacter sp.]
MSEGRVEDIYARVKAQVVGFGIRPGERINEVVLARDLGVSRTPLREALNRLVAERLVEVRPGTGFFCRTLEPQAVFDLYELRRIIEVSAVMLACQRASDEALAAFAEDTIAHGLDVTGLSVAEATARDEAFHVGIAEMTGNTELAAELRAINDRIRFIRWVNMAARVAASKDQHRAILQALLDRDEDGAGDAMADHISRRKDQVSEAVKEGISTIYIGGPDELMARVPDEV